MKDWEASQPEVNKIKPDKEMARSLLKMMGTRLSAVESLDEGRFASIIVEGYYEIVKEGITALMAIGGYKTLSHEVLIGYLKEFYKQFSWQEIIFIDDLRRIRNKIVYKGFFVRKEYLERNEKQVKEIIKKLRRIIEQKLLEEDER